MYRTPEIVSHSKIVFESRPSKLLEQLLTVTFVGLALFALLMLYGSSLSCEREVNNAECSFTYVATFTHDYWTARGGEVRVIEGDFHTPHASMTRTYGVTSFDEAAMGYAEFVADKSARTFHRHFFGDLFAVIPLLIPLVLIPFFRSRPIGQRMRADVDNDELVIEEMYRKRTDEKLRHKLSTIGEMEIESVWDTDSYEVRHGEKALFRGTNDECQRVKMTLVPIVAEAKKLHASE